MTATRITPVIGHAPIIALLGKALESGRLVHAYLFVGPTHVGKATVARSFAMSLLGGTPLATHPDFFPVARLRDEETGAVAASITIDQVRELRQRLSMGAMLGGAKVALIEDAHRMTTEAANALLKCLEEPHPRTLIVLTAENEELVMPTIRSRCQTIRFPRVPTAQVRDALASRGVGAADADRFARLADGAPGRALAFAADPAMLADMESLRDRILAMPGQPYAERWRALDAVFPAKTSFAEAGAAARIFLDLAAELLRDALLLRHDLGSGVVHEDVRTRIAWWAGSRDRTALLEALRRLDDARDRIRSNVNPRAALEHVVAAL